MRPEITNFESDVGKLVELLYHYRCLHEGLAAQKQKRRCICGRSHRIAVVLVTHTGKMEAEDPLEAINGVTGAADAVLVLARRSKGTTLYGRGRDIEEIESMKFAGGRWPLLGEAQEVQ
jgi:hypothetical protein